jgi:hypothetical protein
MDMIRLIKLVEVDVYRFNSYFFIYKIESPQWHDN